MWAMAGEAPAGHDRLVDLKLLRHGAMRVPLYLGARRASPRPLVPRIIPTGRSGACARPDDHPLRTMRRHGAPRFPCEAEGARETRGLDRWLRHRRTFWSPATE